MEWFEQKWQELVKAAKRTSEMVATEPFTACRKRGMKVIYKSAKTCSKEFILAAANVHLGLQVSIVL